MKTLRKKWLATTWTRLVWVFVSIFMLIIFPHVLAFVIADNTSLHLYDGGESIIVFIDIAIAFIAIEMIWTSIDILVLNFKQGYEIAEKEAKRLSRMVVIFHIVVYIVFSMAVIYVGKVQGEKDIQQYNEMMESYVETYMEKYHLEFVDSPFLRDLELVKDKCSVGIDYETSPEQWKIERVVLEYDCKKTMDFKEIYGMMNDIYRDKKLSEVQKDIEEGIQIFLKEGKPYYFEDFNCDRRLSIYIEESETSDYKVKYDVGAVNFKCIDDE